MPTCNCERDTAAQTFGSEGISTIGVGRDSSSCVGDGIGVATWVGVSVGVDVLCGSGVSVGAGAFVGGGGVGVNEAPCGGDTGIGVGGGGVDVLVEGINWDDAPNGILIKNRKINKRIMATISLNRS